MLETETHDVKEREPIEGLTVPALEQPARAAGVVMGTQPLMATSAFTHSPWRTRKDSPPGLALCASADPDPTVPAGSSVTESCFKKADLEVWKEIIFNHTRISTDYHAHGAIFAGRIA